MQDSSVGVERSLTTSNDLMGKSYVNVTVRQGKLRGITVQNVIGGEYYAFRGIPYAKPPVGKLRFQDPQPPNPWTGTRYATKYGDICAQMKVFSGIYAGSEDCLYLNVYTTCLEPTVKRPVMVCIHDGGFINGDGKPDTYGPDYLIKKDIVLVTFNYRLGILGFLNLEDEAAPGNQGMKDQVMALRWVQENIASFGGDAQNVTIFGQSSGSASAHYLCLSPMAQGLFHKAILQSGVLINPWAYFDHGRKFALQAAATLGEFSMDPKTIVESLRSMDTKKLIEAQAHIQSRQEKMQFIRIFGPSNDSKSPVPFFPMSKAEALKADIKVPIIIGYASQEGLLPAIVSKSYLESEKTKNKYEIFNRAFETVLHPAVRQQLQEENIPLQKFKRWYFGDDTITEEHVDKHAEMLGDAMFINGIMKVVNGVADKQIAPAYLYRFSYGAICLVHNMLGIDVPGACHSTDLCYIFHIHMGKAMGYEPYAPGTKEYNVMSYFVQLWTDFAKTGDPTPVKTDLIPVKWEPLKNSEVYNYLDISAKLELKTARRDEQRFEWSNLDKKLL